MKFRMRHFRLKRIESYAWDAVAQRGTSIAFEPRQPTDLYPAEEFQRRCSGPCTVEIVPQCDHFYAGREAAVSAIVSRWLRHTLQGAQQ